MDVNEKAAAVVELGMVRLTQFDAQKRVTGVEVAGRNLDIAQVRFSRSGGKMFVPMCVHKSADGVKHDHQCEGHKHGHVCYHARAGLMFAVAVEGNSLTFHKTEAAARVVASKVFVVMVPNQPGKAVWAAYRSEADEKKKAEADEKKKAEADEKAEAERAEAEARAEWEADRDQQRHYEDRAEHAFRFNEYND